MTDRQWFEWVYGQYYEKVKKAAYRIKLRKLGRRDEPWAEDIAQTVFDKLYEGMIEKDLRRHPDIEKWLIVTLRNTIGSELQKAYHRCEMQLDDLDTRVGATYEMLADDPFPPELTGDERAILYLRFCQERYHEEIAEILGCSCEASRQRLSRAVSRYKKFKNFDFCDTLRLPSTQAVCYTDKRGEQHV